MSNPWKLFSDAASDWSRDKFSNVDPKTNKAFKNAIGKNKKAPDTKSDDNSGSEPISVKSSAIDDIKYNEETKTLTIKYKNGSTEYDFPNVPKKVVDDLLNSDSKGKFVQTIIIPQYSTNRSK